MLNPDNFFHTTIGQTVRSWRLHRHLTVTALTQQAGRPITKGYISQLEHDKIRQPNDAHLIRIANALGITVQDLVTRTKPNEPRDLTAKGNELFPARGDEEVSTQGAMSEGLNTTTYIARDLIADPTLRAAYLDLQTILADPQMRSPMLQLLSLLAFGVTARIKNEFLKR